MTLSDRMLRLTLLLLTLAGLPLAQARGAEPWADPGLTVREGLLIWLDSARQPAARKAAKLPDLFQGQPVNLLLDASGNRIHLYQPIASAQPKYFAPPQPAAAGGSEPASIQFDGEDDALIASGLDRNIEKMTLFVVAAPLSNQGFFKGLLCFGAASRNDYTSGFNLDQSGFPSGLFEMLNLEGVGFGGQQDMMTDASPFGSLKVIEITCEKDRKGVKLFIDGRPQLVRQRSSDSLRMEQFILGARYYSNDARPASLGGFLHGHISEVLLFDRVLDEDQRKQIRQYLAQKHKPLQAALLGGALGGGKLLDPVKDHPGVQVLVPGFSVRKLPLELTNINNLKYRQDGKLYALGYNGNIWLLTDTDGDGLEDKATLFWDKGGMRGPIGMEITPKGYAHGQGVFVPSKGKVSLFVDTDGDDKADKEIIVASGWKEIAQSVDAVGVAMAADGSIYFGLGTQNFANAYVIEKDGKARYDLKSDHGTIQHVSPDFKTRSIVSTGVRFTIALAFNQKGTLFASEQEGATWLANGNPLDELLHIRTGRHYGFPPRHPTHLPGVIDEPSTFDYGPQHQSTCGLHFNYPINGGPTFGPASWAGRAIVAGESRGKIYLTQLVESPRTPDEYVARTTLLACLKELTIDACPSPAGDLVIATHSGPPDWGTGPSGKGTLYKISYTDKQAPQPVAIWPASEREVRIAFDRPLSPGMLRDLAARISISHGVYVRAGDRFETLQPPYEVVRRQLATPRFSLPVLGAQVSPDRRTLIIATAPHQPGHDYALTLADADTSPGAVSPATSTGILPRHRQTDLDYSLSGVQATWKAADGRVIETWLPHLDMEIARAFTAGSAEHDAFFEAIKGQGTLTLQMKLNLKDMLRPAVQPGAQLDYKLPPERVTVRFLSNYKLNMVHPAALAAPALSGGPGQFALEVAEGLSDPLDLQITLEKNQADPIALGLLWQTKEDSRPRPMPIHRFIPRWVGDLKSVAQQPAATLPIDARLTGGSWARGRAVFHSEQALCSKCHSVGGTALGAIASAGRIGPDLANLPHRDYDSILRDIANPSAAIHPDHIAYTVTLKDGSNLSGTPRSDGADHTIIADLLGNEKRIPRSQIQSMAPLPISGMPPNLNVALGPDRTRDLLTFLMTPPPSMPKDRPGAPPARRRSEVLAALAGSQPLPAKLDPLRIVLVAGKKDHGIGEHDYPAWQKMWGELMSVAPQVTLTKAMDWPSAEDLKSADLIVFFSANPAWKPERGKDLDDYLARGKGLVFIHYAVNGGKWPKELADRIGLAAAPYIKFRHGDLDLSIKSDHPITRNFSRLQMHDESYWNMLGDVSKITTLATGVEEGKSVPLIWTTHRQPGQGRVFCSIPGHYSWSFDDPLFRILLLRGMAWAAEQPVDRFNELSTLGVQLMD